MLYKVVGVLYDDTQTKQVGFRLFNLSADFIEVSTYRVTSVLNAQLLAMLKANHTFENMKIDNTGLTITDGQASDLPCYTVSNNKCFRNADMYIVLARVMKAGELQGYTVLNSAGVYFNVSIPELRRNLHLKFFNIVNSENVIRAKHGDMFEKEMSDKGSTTPATPSNANTSGVTPSKNKAADKAADAPVKPAEKTAVISNPLKKADNKPVNRITVVVVTEKPSNCKELSKPKVTASEVEYTTSMYLSFGLPIKGKVNGKSGIYIANVPTPKGLLRDDHETASYMLPNVVEKGKYMITTLYVNPEGEVIKVIVMDSESNLTVHSKTEVLKNIPRYLNLLRGSDVMSGKNIRVTNTPKVSIIYVEPKAKGTAAGYHNYDGSPKILPLCKPIGKDKVERIDLVSSMYLSALDNDDLTAIYNYLNTEYFATANTGRLPAIEVQWAEDSGLVVTPYSHLEEYNTSGKTFKDNIGDYEYVASPTYITISRNTILHPESFYPTLLYFMVAISVLGSNKSKLRDDTYTMLEKRTGIDLASFYDECVSTGRYAINRTLKNFVCPRCGAPIMRDGGGKFKAIRCNECGADMNFRW